MNNNDITMKRHCVNSVQTTAMAAVKRFFCVFFILFAFVSNVLAATVTETYEVPSDAISTITNANVYGTDNVVLKYAATPVNVYEVDNVYFWKTNSASSTKYTVTPNQSGTITFYIYNKRDGAANAYYKGSQETTLSVAAGTVAEMSFEVTAGTEYTVGVKSTNMCLGGYTFTYESGATDYSCLSVGSTSKTVSNKYIYEYNNCDGKYSSDETRLMDCVYNDGYVKFKIKPTIAGNYLLTSKIGTKNANRHVEISCTGDSYSYSKKHDIRNNGSWTDGDSYEWIFENLEANKEYVVTITCTDTNKNGATDGNYQVNILTTTIQWVETADDGDDSGSTVTPAGGTFSMTDGLVDVNDENDLGLDLLSSAETFTVTGPNTSNPTYPSGSSTKDKFANGAVITYFNGYYYCMWQSSNEGEDSQDTWVAYSRSADGITWETPKVLVSDDTSNNVINTSGGWYVDKTNNKLIGYINNWTVSGWSDTDVKYYGTTTTGKKIGDKQSLKTCYVSTTDGVTWTSPAEVKMSDGTTLNGIFEQDPYVTSSGRIINAAHFTSSLVPCPIYTDNVDGVTGWKKATTFDINGSGGMEPSVYQKTDGTTVMEFRTGSYYKYASASTDNGVTWTAVEATNVPDAHTKQSAGNLPDGTSYLVGTPKNEESEDVTDSNYKRLLRKPLAILLSKDGTTFDTGYCLRTSDDNGGKNASGTYDGIDAAGGHAYSGLYKRPGYHYTKSMVANGYLWISYATNKETVQVTRVPLSDISLNTVSGGTSDVSVKIDFDNRDVTTNSSFKDTSDGYQSWFIAETTKNNTTSKTFNDITFTLSHGDNSQGEKLSRTWNSTAVSGNAATDESKLINDGIYSCMSDDTYGGYGTTTERVEIDVTISGLSVGTYSLLAYHNYTFSDSHTLPTIGVEVNGVVQQTGIKQSQKVLTLAESASSLVTFEVTTEGKDIVVTYFSEPDGSTSYTRTYFLINSLELGSSVVSVGNKIQNASPVNADYHTAHDNGNVTLSWSSAANGASSHIVYFGTNEESVINGTAEMTTQTSTTLTKTGLSPLKRYYWRVDEVIDGIAYQGDVMSFQPRRLAFPGADGAGKYAVGGRGWDGNGDVYHVTNLNDTGEGSLRYGIENATGPRTIVFDVAGVITLASDLKCNKPYITVAGQTAPGIGILLRDDSYSADSEDGITRFMRFRFGHGDDWDPNSGVGNSNVGNAAGMQTNFHIMDHCMLGWGSDETFASRGAKNISFQHNIIGESLNQNGHDKYYDTNPTVQHGYAATIGGETGSYHHNLLAHNEGRNWSMSGGLSGQTFAGKMNMYNNVVYNWHGRTTDGGTHNGNFVNNYYKMMSTAENSNTRLELFEATHEDNYQGSQEYYVAGNIRQNKDGSETEDKEGVTYVSVISSKLQVGDAGYPTYDTFASTPYDCWNVESKSVSEIESAQSAFKNVLSDVGCNYKQLDNNEKRLIEETLKGTYSKTGSRSKLLGLIDKESDSEGWNGLGMVEATRPGNWDADQDGIPAWFETAMGWNDSAGNNNDDSDGDYWTDLEEYLNWVAVPHFYDMADDGTVTALKTGTNHTITLADYFAGYTSPSYTVVSNGGATATINNGVLTYNFPANSSKLATIQVKATQDGISLTRSFNFFIDASDVEVTPEGTAYTLTSSTYTSSTNTTTWNFNNGFAITNAKGKAYASANNETIKYSNGIQFTITIPDGMSANGIKFYGYANDDSSDGYIAELNGETYGEDQYVFPSRANSTTEEYTIAFAQPATGTITFTVNKQCALAITLYITGTPAVTPDDDTELAPAFPGAEGHGRYAQGGRGTDGFTNVYHVTSLADDGSEGTLRWALAQTGPRTIVFDVSGYIDLASDLKIPNNTTIAGQTAPAPGITLRYYTVNTSDAENVIIRYMRFRRSQVKDVNDGADAAWGRHGNNIILDHCSFSWSIDEVASFYDNRDFTMQWCVVAEGLCNSGHTKGGHSYGGIWGGKNATFHHNMITNVHNRAPRLCGARFNWDGYDTEAYGNSVQAERVDVRNNLYYNWGNGNGAYGGMGGYHNLVNNYYKAGPGTKNTSRVFQGSANSSDDSNGVLPDGLPGRFYIYGNYVTAQSAIYDWSGFKQDSGTGVNTTDLTYTDSQGLYGAAGATVSIKLDGEVDMADVTTHTAANAYDKILLYGGASLYRDAVDERFMTDAKNGTTQYQMTETTDGEGNAVTEFTKGIVDKINDPAAAAVAEQPSFPMLAVVERPTNWDTDRDGMPDAWEDANGLNKNSAADGNLYTLDSEKTWYTNLEVYLNSIVEDITRAQTKGAEIEIEDEYYPEWIEPTAESLTEFVLSNETHSYGSANVWTFSNGFGVTGQEGRTYASAGDYIKYSNGYEYTISVPSNVTVYKVKVEGYANAAVGTTSYLAAFGTQTFDATRYVFPSGNASVNRASYEFSLPEAVTGGTLKIQATGAQTCMIVTLYGKEKSYDLDEVANEMRNENETININETGTITWKFDEGNGDKIAEYSAGIADYIKSATVTLGAQLDYKETKEVNVVTETLVQPKVRNDNPDETNTITFSVEAIDGATFTPTNVKFYISRIGTDAGYYDAKIGNEGGYSTIATGEKPDRNTNTDGNNYYTIKDFDVSSLSASQINSLIFNIYNLAANKQIGLANIIITGTLKYTTSTTKTIVTLDEMATVHNLEAAENVTVEMKRGLTAGAWNTFCVPFNLTKTELEAALDDDVEVVKYTKQEGTTLHFEDIEDTDIIEAGKPYLIKPASFSRTYEESKTTPITFEGVNLIKANVTSNGGDVAETVTPTGADYSFVGTYVRYIMKTDGTELGLNSKNKLAKPAASINIMRGLRGFFRYNAGNGAGAKVVINGELTSIDEIEGFGTMGAEGVYHISGHFVRKGWNNGDGLQRGVYIVNGKKMVKY
ncbi:MAG: exo-alpha-sialidase [Prevotella sp.]|nr:exo-alpha-sialidase [Prevotella sp.]